MLMIANLTTVLRLFLLLAVCKDAICGQWKQNHVEINDQRKHIDVETSWLPEKSERPTQQLGLDASNKEKVLLDLISEQKVSFGH